MKKGILYIILILNSLLAFAQSSSKNDEDIVVVSNDYIANEKAILIKWFSTDYVPKEGYNVYRKLDQSSNWEKINQQPVILNQTKSANLKIDTEEENYWNLSKKLKTQDIPKAGFIIGITYLKMINSFDFSLLMGMAYRDNTVESGKSYKYMIKTIKNGKEILVDSSMAIKQGTWQPDSEIRKIVADRKKKEVDFKFKVEHHLYYALDVEKKAGNNPFKSLNKAPILLQKDENGQFSDIVYTDKPIHKDSAYSYKIYGVNYFGLRTLASSEISVAAKDFDPPKPVLEVLYDQDTLDVKLTWKPASETESDLKGYNVYRSEHYDKDYEKVNPSLIGTYALAYTDKVPNPGDYYYMITAVDKGENESNSVAIMANIKDVVAPARPFGIQAVAESGKVKISWFANTEKDLKGYLLFKSLAGNGMYVPVNGEPIKEFYYEEKLAKQVKNRFVYKVIAVDSSFNRSQFSDSVTVKLPDLFPPATPVIKDILVVDGKGLKIEWLQSVDNDLATYSIYRTDTKAKDQTPVLIAEKISKSKADYIDVTAIKNNNYSYYITAIDSSNNSSVQSTSFPFKWIDSKSHLKIKKIDVKLKELDKTARITWAIETDEQYIGCVLYRAYNN